MLFLYQQVESYLILTGARTTGVRFRFRSTSNAEFQLDNFRLLQSELYVSRSFELIEWEELPLVAAYRVEISTPSSVVFSGTLADTYIDTTDLGLWEPRQSYSISVTADTVYGSR